MDKKIHLRNLHGDKSVNILVLNYEFPPIGGGGGAVSRDLAISLQRRGHRVLVITMQYGSLPEKEEIEGVVIYRVKCLRKSESVCHPWEQISYIFSLIGFYLKHLSKEQFDVCHAHFIVPTGVAALYLKKKLNIPYVITAHGSDVEGYNQKRFRLLHVILRPIWRILVREARAVVAPSFFLESLMQKRDRNIAYTVIPNGIDLAYYRKLARIYSKTKSMVVLCRLQKPKGVQDIIRAFAQVKSQNWKLNILGDGPYRNELESLTRKLGIEDRVIFYGWVKNKSEKYEQLLGEGYLYLSGSWFENCPVSVLEAAGAGCRVLLSDIPAHRQLMKKQDVFFPCGNIKVLAERMETAIEMYDGEAIEVYEAERYDWGKVCARYEEVLN